MSTAKTIAKGSAWILIAMVIVKLFAWVYYVVIARIVSQEEIRAFFLVLGITGIFGLFSNLGLGEGAIVRYVPFYAEHLYMSFY